MHALPSAIIENEWMLPDTEIPPYAAAVKIGRRTSGRFAPISELSQVGLPKYM
jgi:hypothetical protein